jgi:ribonuclease T1
MDRTWKIYGIFVVLGGLLFGSTGTLNASSSTEPTVPSASIPSGQSAAPALQDATPPLDRQLHRVAKDPPQRAKDLLEAIQQHEGKPLPGYIGGRAFQNRERRLPLGHYREYDVNPKIRGRPRDVERIVIEQNTGRAYYTDNHYRTFMPLNEIPCPPNTHSH